MAGVWEEALSVKSKIRRKGADIANNKSGYKQFFTLILLEIKQDISETSYRVLRTDYKKIFTEGRF